MMMAGDWPEGRGPSMAADNDLTTTYYDNYVLGSSWTVRFAAERARGTSSDLYSFVCHLLLR
jgi:hypothetical protein